MRLGDLLAVSDDLLALADLKEDVLDLRALPFLPQARLGVVVREVRLQGAPDELRDGAGGARRQVAELGGADALHVLPRGHEILDAVDVAHRLLGRADASQRADHDPALPVGGEEPALLDHERRGSEPGHPQRGPLHGGIEPAPREVDVVVVFHHGL